MPSFPSPLTQTPYPALYLYPLNDSFVPKHIALLPNQRVKIGRQTNAKTVPAERNGYFDSKVLSRQHAEVWEEGGKIFIKDVKSSNGTFINGERLSGEGLESEPFELKTDDVVEFGIDIVGEDNRTIIHHKVAARVVCVMNEQEMQLAARAEAAHPPLGPLGTQAGPGGFNFVPGQAGGVNGGPGPQRRSTMQQGLVGMGGMGAGVRAPGKSGITFDHLLSRLQGELQKSRETGADLHNLNNSMADIHETLGGNVPPNNASFPSSLPPVVPPHSNQPSEPHPAAPPPPANAQDSTSALAELQAQLQETQMSLASHVEKIRSLEAILAEHEAIKHEVSLMRDMMEERKREMELLRIRSQSPTQLRRHPSRMDESLEDESMDDDDARSVATVVMHELERVEEEDEEQIAAEEEEEERRRRRDELGRPRTPEPTGMGLHEDDEEHENHPHETSDKSSHLHPPSSSATISAPSPNPPSIPDDLIQRINQLESALEISRSFEAQQLSAQSAISQLESKVQALEAFVQATHTQVQAQGELQVQHSQALEAKRLEEPTVLTRAVWEEERARDRDSLTSMLSDWKKTVEGQWTGVHEEWSEERDRLRRAKEEFESRIRTVEDTVGSTAVKVENGLASMASFQLSHQIPQTNGSAKVNGLVTPPSPRSLSAAATRPRQRKRRPSSSRGRSRSRSTSPSPVIVGALDDSPSSPASHDTDDTSSTSSHLRNRASWITDDSSVGECEQVEETLKLGEPRLQKGAPGMYPTPDPSLLDQPVSGLSSSASTVVAEAQTKGHPKELPQFQSLSAVIGVVVLGVAAAAVIWRVKPEGGV